MHVICRVVQKTQLFFKSNYLVLSSLDASGSLSLHRDPTSINTNAPS